MITKNNKVARLGDGGIGWLRDGIFIGQSLGRCVEQFVELLRSKAGEVEIESLLLEVDQFLRQSFIVPG